MFKTFFLGTTNFGGSTKNWGVPNAPRGYGLAVHDMSL